VPSSPPLTVLQKLRADARHYQYANGAQWYGHWGFWIGAVYRWGHWAGSIRFPLARFIALIPYVAASFPIRVLMHVNLLRQAKIGPGLCMHHPQNIILPSDSVLGADVTIYQEVTIGRGPVPGVPRIGNRVVIYAGAKVLGGITIGDDCEIGANVVVTRDIPPNCVVSTAPIRAIPKATIVRLRQEQNA
jgi:serine O-acetyltransferase